MAHKRETCRLCGTRTRQLFTHVWYSHDRPATMSAADGMTALMRSARGIADLPEHVNGSRYAEAIRGARAMRHAAMTSNEWGRADLRGPMNYSDDDPTPARAWGTEYETGAPAGWITRGMAPEARLRCGRASWSAQFLAQFLARHAR